MWVCEHIKIKRKIMKNAPQKFIGYMSKTNNFLHSLKLINNLNNSFVLLLTYYLFKDWSFTFKNFDLISFFHMLKISRKTFIPNSKFANDELVQSLNLSFYWNPKKI